MTQRKDTPDAAPDTRPIPEPDSKAGFDQEVGDLDADDSAQDEDALRGRVGGGLAGG